MKTAFAPNQSIGLWMAIGLVVFATSLNVKAQTPNCGDVYDAPPLKTYAGLTAEDQRGNIRHHQACDDLPMQNMKAANRTLGTYSSSPFVGQQKFANAGERQKLTNLAKTIFERLRTLLKKRLSSDPATAKSYGALIDKMKFEIHGPEDPHCGGRSYSAENGGYNNDPANPKISLCESMLFDPPASWVGTMAHEFGHAVFACKDYYSHFVKVPTALLQRMKSGDRSLYQSCALPGILGVDRDKNQKAIAATLQSDIQKASLNFEENPFMKTPGTVWLDAKNPFNQNVLTVIDACGLGHTVVPHQNPASFPFASEMACAVAGSLQNPKAEEGDRTNDVTGQITPPVQMFDISKFIDPKVKSQMKMRYPIANECSRFANESYADLVGGDLTAEYSENFSDDSRQLFGFFRLQSCDQFAAQTDTSQYPAAFQRVGAYMRPPHMQDVMGCRGFRRQNQPRCPYTDTQPSSSGHPSPNTNTNFNAKSRAVQ